MTLLCVVYSLRRTTAIAVYIVWNFDAGNVFLPCCERVLQVLSTNLLLLNSEVFIWSLMCRVFGNDFNRSALFYQSAVSLLVVQAFLECWPWSWESVKAGQGVLGVCMCVHFSFLNPKPNRIDFWNHCPCLFSPSVQVTESWRFCFLCSDLAVHLYSVFYK